MVAATMTISLAAAAALSAPRSWDTYRTIMWIQRVPEKPDEAALFFRRLREMGCNAASCYPGMDPQAFVRNQMPFYVENVTRPLFIKGDPWKRAWEGYRETLDPKFFVRKPCLSDPAVSAETRKRAQEIVRRYRDFSPFAYDIRDEPSITTSANPFDFCMSDFCLPRFRRWLSDLYGTLDALNAEWETDFASWEDVVPFMTWDAKERDRKGHLNYAPWADHRAFMDHVFAEAVREYGTYIRELDPQARVGLEGTQMPHAFGGYNFPLLLKQLDWIEPYDIGNSREVVRSLRPDIPVISTVFETDEHLISRRLWYLALHGDRGAVVWWSKTRIDWSKSDIPVSPAGRALRKPFVELTSGVVDLLIRAQRQSDSIAIHYSQPSIRADWIIESRPDGRTWIRRFSSYEAEHNQLAAARNSFVKLVEDLGFQFDFVSSEQVEAGRLLDAGYRVFVMPRSYALSDAEAERIRRFVRAGGTVIADGVCGLYDEHCRARKRGALDDLFGVAGHHYVCSGSGEPVSAGLKRLEPDLPPADRQVGRGRAVYLNLDVTPYQKLRLKPGPGDRAVRGLFRGLLPTDLTPAHSVTLAGSDEPVPAVEVHRFLDGQREYLGVMRNPEFRMTEDLKAYGGNEALEAPLDITVHFSRRAHVYDLRERRYVGEVSEVTTRLDPWSPRLYMLSPGRQDPFAVTSPGAGGRIKR